MRNFNLLLLITATFFWISCSSDDSDNPVNPGNGGNNDINYLDQDLQGSIDGVPWTYNDGIAFTNPTSGDSSLSWFYISLSDQADSGSCFFNNPSQESYVLFTWPHEGPVVPVFSQALNFDFSSGGALFTITLVAQQDTSSIPLNIIMTEGGLEINEVDTANQTISGRMDIRDGTDSDENRLNGNFTIRYCGF